MATLRQAGRSAAALLLGLSVIAPAPRARAAEHITLRNGFDLVCDHREPAGDRVRLFLTASGPSFIEVDPASIVASETVALPAPAAAADSAPPPPPDIPTLLARAGSAHDLDIELLASVIRAESGGNVHAVSHAGARGLMQLMPSTAAKLGVADSFRPDQNIDGGTAYLNRLLLRYHDNLALALAAYNAGPAAVDRYHGIPPYRETRAYVARIIHDYNRRKAAGHDYNRRKAAGHDLHQAKTSAAGNARSLAAAMVPAGQ
jgi:soluble lytic murein transglycosylase-like protein